MIPQEVGLSHGPLQHQTPGTEGNGQRILQIKADLTSRCQKLPPAFWDKVASSENGPDLLIVMLNNSPLLSKDFISGFIELFLTREGILVEKIVHYANDDNSERDQPDEVLGETNNQRYLEAYDRAVYILDTFTMIAPSLKTTSPEQ